ncbi:two-component system, chemotaxis family, response regulator CheY [Mariprofundus micogutta]|uniref:histidine kinase n=1 Tax=Mariprofundus micogutta TaxID=1921010 RepID=A0A1L8CQN4_9PROT|nr:PAS domain-containing sensor histidine kinase [Mariprofundus micogutta]GAV21230.1 two-component system, chemotaxis family, response regulator CheY [Mariprofundus micogutta]
MGEEGYKAGMESSVEIEALSVFDDRRKVLALVHMNAAAALVLFSIIQYVEPGYFPLAVTEAALAVVMVINYWWIGRGADLTVIENILMLCAVILFSALVYLDSIENTGVYWVAGYPFVAYFVHPARQAKFWVAGYACLLAATGFLVSFGFIELPYSAIQVFCLVAVVLFFSVLSHIYKSQLELRTHQLAHFNRQLEQQQKRMQVVLDHSPIGIWMIDAGRHIQFLNKSWVTWSGISEEQAREVDDYTTLLSDELAESSLLSDQACLNGEGAHYFNQEVLCADDQLRTFDMIKVKLTDSQGKVTGLVGFAIDITDKLQAEIEQATLERQVQHSQRLESLGVMAGGIAHDFNNLLTAIQGSVELAKLEGSLSSGLQESLECIDTASKAAADLCRQMLAYSGKGLFKPEQLQLCDLVDEMRSLLDVSISKNISLQFHQCQQSSLIQGDRGQINQVLLNLVINASEAIGTNAPGEINISITVEDLSNPDTHSFSGAELIQGQYVVLKVEDNGCGMDAEVIEHMFDPFFTTKFTGRGLGMSAILGILNAHEGGLEVTSTPGSGTTMTVWFPHQNGIRDDSQKPQTQAANTSGRVLVVDDEQAVLNVAKRMLERLGLEVETAHDGREAVAAYSADQRFDWVLLDVTMPEMDGVECLKKLREINPDLYVVMSSGYDPENALALSENSMPNDFLTKPYTIEALRQVVEKTV